MILARVCALIPTPPPFKEALGLTLFNVTLDSPAANLYSCYPEADLLEFVNAPIGKARPIEKKLKPLIAGLYFHGHNMFVFLIHAPLLAALVPTTAGTGSETTGVAIFDLVAMKAKTGIASRALKRAIFFSSFLCKCHSRLFIYFTATLGIVDPENNLTTPPAVRASCGLDVFW